MTRWIGHLCPRRRDRRLVQDSLRAGDEEPAGRIDSGSSSLDTTGQIHGALDYPRGPASYGCLWGAETRIAQASNHP